MTFFKGPLMLAAPSTLSFHPVLVAALSQLLTELEWNAPHLPACLAEILAGLARYREEGKRLFPAVFVTSDLNHLLTSVSGTDPLTLGTGPLHPDTVQRALKQCAPLGEGRTWVVFLSLENHRMRYGVFRSPASPIEPTSLERLRRLSDPRPRALGMAQLAENVLELRGSSEFFRYICLSGGASQEVPPMQVTRSFIQALTRDVPPELKEPMGHLYYRLTMDVMQTWHGTLAAIVRDGQPFPREFSDGVVLDPPLQIAETVRRFQTQADFATTAELQSQMNLIRGMMNSDGILVFSTNGSLLAYNVFLRHKEELELPFAAVGGARRRTFEFLRKLVGTELVAAFIRSQDGSAHCATDF